MMPGLPGAPEVSGLAARLRSLWRGLRRRRDVEAEMVEEFHHHLALLTEDLVRRGLPPEAAARRARIEFGHIPSHQEDARAARGLGVLDGLAFSWLDVKLGVRMLRKYPGLSVVSVVGMSVAIAVAAGYFAGIGAMIDPTVPLDEGERIVSIQNAAVDDAADGGEARQTTRDLVAWREQLTTVRELAAFTTGPRNLLAPGRAPEPVEVARMTASGFRVARTSPALGRPLLEEDERAGAPPVVVIAHEEWQRVFGGDPGILGRPVRLGGDVHTVVGVMPPGFRFPVSHRYWVPLPQRPADAARGDGPSLFVFGRLADGATLDAAQAELAVVGSRMAAAYPETHRHLRPRITPYTYPFIGIDGPGVATAARALQFAVGLLLVLVSANVAVLVYARTATRGGEIAMRTALGASRRRVITQLFAEAFVLSAVAATIGLTLAGAGLASFETLVRDAEPQLPFWVDLRLSPALVAYVAGLAVVGGVIVGVIPGLQMTGRRVQAGLQQLGTRGSKRELGRTWTTLIVVQVALAMAVLPFAVYTAGKSVVRGTADAGYPAEEILRTSLFLEREDAPPAVDSAASQRALDARFRTRVLALLRRLEAEPAVAGVTLASHFPGSGRSERIEVEGAAGSASSGGGVLTSRIGADLFTVFDVPVVAGRAFVDADARDSTAVIVDRTFEERYFGGASAVGRHVRIVESRRGGQRRDGEPGPWLEVVGVVPAFTAASDFDASDPKLYRPLAPDAAAMGVHLALRVRGGSTRTLAARVRDVAAAVDPALQLDELQSADDAERRARRAALFVAIGITVVTVSVLLLSATGIYAMMAFTVARQRREIGIRAALGADSRRVLTSVFARASAQLGAGVMGGLVLAVVVDRAAGGGALEGRAVVLLPAVAALMTVVGLLAALGPARRGLAVQPSEALREE